MAGMHAVQKMLAERSHPREATVSAAVLAESFGRLFLSNCVSAGLWAITFPGISAFAQSGDALELDLASWKVRNLSNGQELAANPLPEFFREMTAAGGEKPYLKTRIARDRASTNSA